MHHLGYSILAFFGAFALGISLAATEISGPMLLVTAAASPTAWLDGKKSGWCRFSGSGGMSRSHEA